MGRGASSLGGNGFQCSLGVQSPLGVLRFGVRTAGVTPCGALPLYLPQNAATHPYICILAEEWGESAISRGKWNRTRAVLGLEMEAAICAPYPCDQDVSAQHPPQKIQGFCAFSAQQLCWGHHLPRVCSHSSSPVSQSYSLIFFYQVPTKHRIDFFNACYKSSP